MYRKKVISRVTSCLTVFAFIFSLQSNAQSLDDIKMQMVKDWERAKAYTSQYLNTMPADKYSFKPVDSIRSFAQQMLHLSQVNGFLMSNAIDQQPPAFVMTDLEHRTSAQTKDSVVYFVTKAMTSALTR